MDNFLFWQVKIQKNFFSKFSNKIYIGVCKYHKHNIYALKNI